MNALALAVVAASIHAQNPHAAPPVADPPSVCDSCDEWNQPQKPFKLHGRSYYVGVRGLSAVLIQTSDGLILLDGGLPQSAPLIEGNLRSLGFKVEDIRLIVNSHAHYDHAGGIARLQRDSGAEVAASASGAAALRAGMPVPDDPQFGKDGREGAFPRVSRVRVVKDKEELRVGDTAITAHLTPGHTPGSTAWTWRSCEGGSCLDLVYADSLTAISLDGFRFTGDKTHPDVSETFKRSIATVEALPCDLMLSTHPGASGLFERLERRESSPVPDPLLDKQACRAYADKARRNLDQRLQAERAAAPRF
ncbi:MAG TPA: subclass B3 metallo-beta-lactamase [Vicinamibacteria bacterium]|nr:subclass B3 metallo-beta-lactamase [Vicinamibacteria bacterium]